MSESACVCARDCISVSHSLFVGRRDSNLNLFTNSQMFFFALCLFWFCCYRCRRLRPFVRLLVFFSVYLSPEKCRTREWKCIFVLFVSLFLCVMNLLFFFVCKSSSDSFDFLVWWFSFLGISPSTIYFVALLRKNKQIKNAPVVAVVINKKHYLLF